MIDFVKIQNFKSVKNLQIDNVKRINILVGRPNVGKSNIIEALSVFSPGAESSLKDLVRFQSDANLFYDNNINNKVFVIAGNLSYYLISAERHFVFANLPRETDYSDFSVEYKQKKYSVFLNGKAILPVAIDPVILKYKFDPEKTFDYSALGPAAMFHTGLLFPPYGSNLIALLYDYGELHEIFASFFQEYGLELVIDPEKKSFEVQKRIGLRVYKYPFSLVADTLQRIIFYLSVVRMNKNKTIILEEPETHSFPPYIRILADYMAMDENNQYIFSTHNPYLLNRILQKAFDDTNIWLTYFEDYQTKIKVLSDQEKEEIITLDEDLFFNYEKFLS